MKVLHCSGDSIGGGARAALRLHQALIATSKCNSKMLVKNKLIDDWRINEVKVSRLNTVKNVINSAIDSLPMKIFNVKDCIPRSSAYTSMVDARFIDSIKPDLVHLHWVCSGFLSVEQIGKIKSPLVWTLHDMWPFCGSEHLSDDGPLARWRGGYLTDGGLFTDLDRWMWNRKKRAWRAPMHLVAPSNWLANCIKDSALMNSWNISVIPNVLNTESFRPIQKNIAREILGLPQNARLILFGAIKGTSLNYKGWDLLKPALNKLNEVIPNARAMIFGQCEPRHAESMNLPVHWMGHINDDVALSLVYSAADVTVVPSRQEAFGQVGSEAQSCGCPVVAFNATGLMDVVDHKITGYLAKPYSIEDLRQGIMWVLEDEKRMQILSTAARNRAIERWSPQVVIPQYIDVYRQVIGK